MNNQTRNHLNLQKHIADQDHIIRVRNAEIAALRKRAEKAEQERDDARREALALRTEQPRPLTTDDITDEMIERARSAYWGPTYGGNVNERVRAILTAALAPARPEGAERFDPIVDAAIRGHSDITSPDVVRAISDALAEDLADPARPEGAEKVEAVLHQYWSGDINGDDLANRIAEEMNR